MEQGRRARHDLADQRLAVVDRDTGHPGGQQHSGELQGGARLLGQIYPATHMIGISRGVFNKALHFGDLRASLLSMLVAAPVIVGAAILLLRKQER